MRFWKGSLAKQIKYIIGIACLAFCILCIFINGSVKEIMHLEADEYTKVTAVSYQNQIALVYDKMESFFMSMSGEEWIQEIFSGDMGRKAAYIYDAEERLAQFKILEPFIVDIALASDTVHYSNVFGKETLDGLRAGMGSSAFRWAGVIPQEFRDFKGRAPVFVYAGAVYQDTENIGAIVISVDASFLQDEGREMGNSYHMLADEEGIVYPIHLPEGLKGELYAKWREGPRAGDRKEMPFYFHSAYLQDLGCYLVSILDTRHMDMELSAVSRLIWLCLVALGGASVLLFFVINKGFVRPLGRFCRIIQGIRQSGQRKLDGKMELKGCAEMEAIGEEFQGMMEDIQQMNQKIFDNATALYEIEIQKKEAELAFLRSQIDPHFLYNTLEVVRRMAMVKHVPEIAEMVVDIGKIFRYSVKGEDMVSLKEEIGIIKSYLHIQQMRFENKISVSYFISEEALSVVMPKMLIQPLVENAIFYGLEPANQAGSLYIGARVEEGCLTVTVKDDGVGIREGELCRLRERMRDGKWDSNAHIGLMNVHMRVRLHFGEPYGLTVESSREDGTTVTMRLKAQKGQAR